MTIPSAQAMLERLLHAVKTCDSYANPDGALATVVREFEARHAGAAPPVAAAKPVAWRWRSPDRKMWTYDDRKPLNHANFICEPLYAAPSEAIGREEAIERCALICSRVAINAERRAAGHTDIEAKQAAMDKCQAAQQCEQAIRALSVSRPNRGGAA